jgi:hypothetical protein
MEADMPDDGKGRSMPSGACDAEWLELGKIPRLAEESMLAYLLTAIEVRAKLIQELLPADSPQQRIACEVRRKIATFDKWCPHDNANWKNLAWCDAYRLELMLALAEPLSKLVTELELRLAEAKEEQVPCVQRLNDACNKTFALITDTNGARLPITPDIEATLRSQLVNVIEETQWHLKRKFTARTIQKQATYRIILAAICSFALFVSPYAAIIAAYAVNWSGVMQWVDRWTGLPLITALTAGLFGAFFSRLLFMQSSWNTLSLDELKSAREPSTIILRGTVGMCGAVVVYFFLHSELISGEILPKFSDIALIPRVDVLPKLILPNRELALLAVWSFLAGFSERLVPNILATTETTLSKSATETNPKGK